MKSLIIRINYIGAQIIVTAYYCLFLLLINFDVELAFFEVLILNVSEAKMITLKYNSYFFIKPLAFSE